MSKDLKSFVFFPVLQLAEQLGAGADFFVAERTSRFFMAAPAPAVYEEIKLYLLTGMLLYL